MVAATNVRQTSKAGVYQKRKGFDRTAMSFSGATWGSATPSSCVPAKDALGALMRDSLDRVWSYDGSAVSPTWTYRGVQTRVWCDTKTIDSREYTNPILETVEVGDDVWAFTSKADGYETGIAGYFLTIFNKATGEVTYTSTAYRADADGGAGTRIIDGAACYDGTYVWFFWVNSTTSIYSRRFTVSAPGTTLAATYDTAAGRVQGVACAYLGSKVLVAFGGTGGGTSRLYHSSCNRATGVRDVRVQVVNNACALPLQAIGFHANQTDATYAYYHYYGYQVGGSGATYSGPVTVKVTLSDLSHVVINGRDATLGSATDAVVASGICEVTVSPGAARQFVIYSRIGGYSMMTTSDGSTMDGISFPTTTATGSNQAYTGWWIASGLVLYGDALYFIAGLDDVGCSAAPTGTALLAEALSTQRTYHVFKMDTSFLRGTNPRTYSKIVGHALNGLAAAQFHNATSVPLASTTNVFYVARVPRAFLSGTNIIAVVAANTGTTGSVGVTHLKVDTAKEWGRECSANGRAISPGGIPICWSKEDDAHEIAPLAAPSYINIAAAGVGTDFASAAAVYVIRDKDGTLWRSAPYVLSSTIGHGATLYIPTLMHLLPGTTAFIEIYLGTSAIPKLQTTVANPIGPIDYPKPFYSYTTPTAATMVNGDELYAAGGNVSNTWPPQCQAVGYWRQRLFLATRNTLWASLEATEGFGFTLNEVMRSTWGECATDINVMCPLDWNFFSLKGQNAVGVIDGPGPDSRGSGNYTIRTLSTMAGANKTTPARSGPAGCYFQDANTGRPMVVSQDLRVVECAQGAYDYSAETITAISYCEAERQIQFHTASNHIIVLDYQHPTEATPFGQVYVWTPSVAAYAAAEDSSCAFYVGATGDIYRLGSTYRDTNAAGAAVDYRMVIKTAQLQMQDLQGEYDVSRVQVLGKYNAACSVKLTTFPDYSTSGNATTPLAVSAAPFQLVTRPPSCMRIQALALQVEETAGTGAAFEFEGFAIQYLPRGRMKTLNTSQVVT